jgi:mono/diheme cytochrome c family protein
MARRSNPTWMNGAVIGALLLMTAAATGPVAAAQGGPEREVIPGAERMTGAERETYRQRMEAARTSEEKARIRDEYARAAAGSAGTPALVGDPARGAKVHGVCFSCHGIERYTRPVTYAAATFFDSLLRASGLSDLPVSEPTHFKGRIKSLAELREAVARRNDYLNPKLTPQEFEDVVAYLNATYYKFPPPARAP